MEEKFTFFWSGPFSQWAASRFVIDGVEYNTAEQYMMAQKAVTFGDDESLKKIMKSKSPKEQKALGRKVKNFVADKWNAVAKKAVYDANYAKFSQNKDLQKVLFATAGTTLVEASPLDRIWGIGLKETDPRAQNRETWNGTNWLGEVLTQVRDDLMAKEKERKKS